VLAAGHFLQDAVELGGIAAVDATADAHQFHALQVLNLNIQ